MDSPGIQIIGVSTPGLESVGCPLRDAQAHRHGHFHMIIHPAASDDYQEALFCHLAHL